MDTAITNLSEKNKVQAYQKQLMFPIEREKKKKQLLFGKKELPTQKGDRS